MPATLRVVISPFILASVGILAAIVCIALPNCMETVRGRPENAHISCGGLNMLSWGQSTRPENPLLCFSTFN